MKPRNILLIEPFYSGSHKQWADGLMKHSRHNIQLLSLPGKHWKWRMHGGAITLANEYKKLDFRPDLILATDMLDLTTFLAMIRNETHDIPTAVYFHESQFTYPKSPDDTDIRNKRDNHYGFINYTSALCADKVIFNSNYHKTIFLSSLAEMLSKFPDHKNSEGVGEVEHKSTVLPVGLELESATLEPRSSTDKLRILWNHRWEQDKNILGFLNIISELVKQRTDIELVLLGQKAKLTTDIKILIEGLKPFIVQDEYLDSKEEYKALMGSCHVIPVTSYHDFFGISVAEAIHSGVLPLLPNRLAYPELIPDNLHHELLYDNDRTLLNKLLTLVPDNPYSKSLQEHINQFAWSEMISKYDSEFESIS